MNCFCLLCHDTYELECASCRGKGLVGGIWGIGAKACPLCMGSGKTMCPDCFEDLGALMSCAEPQGLGETQSGLNPEASSREVILPGDMGSEVRRLIDLLAAEDDEEDPTLADPLLTVASLKHAH